MHAGALAYNKIRESHFMTRLTAEGRTVFQAAAFFRLRCCEPLENEVKSVSHIACRAHAVPLPFRAAEGLECVFPFTLGLYDRASRRLLMNETNRCTVNFQFLLMAK